MNAPVPQAHWYLGFDDQAHGPMTLDDVRTHVESGRATVKTLAWAPGQDDWRAAGELEALKELFPAPVIAPPPLRKLAAAAPMPPALKAAVVEEAPARPFSFDPFTEKQLEGFAEKAVELASRTKTLFGMHNRGGLGAAVRPA